MSLYWLVSACHHPDTLGTTRHRQPITEPLNAASQSQSGILYYSQRHVDLDAGTR